MEFGLDRAIERLNALKLSAAQQNEAASAVAHHTEENQRGEQRQQEQEPNAAAALQEQFTRMAQQMQDQYERKLKEQEQFYIARIQHEMQQLQRRIDTLEHQNHLLRSAVGSVDIYKAKITDQELVIDGLQDQVKQLRSANYRLQYMVQQTDRTGPSHFMPPPPPDIF